MSLIQQKQEFQRALSEWYAGARRPLPWRTKPSLYRTVVSELMTQQTQIKTMLPYFERWMNRFPDFESLANAPEADVLKHWEGLGYYSRARNLHKLARAWVAASPKPRSREDWQKLPGIGPYTSAAISSIVFEEPDAVVDGNVVRILARLTGDTQLFGSSAAAIKAFRELAQTVLNQEAPGEHNQAMMELGATVCLKRKPLCTICPVAGLCAGRSDPQLEAIPRIARKATERIEIDRAWVVKDGSLLLRRIPTPPVSWRGNTNSPNGPRSARRHPTPNPCRKKCARSPTAESANESSPVKRIPPKPMDCHWVSLDQIDAITLSGPHRKWVNELMLGTYEHRTLNNLNVELHFLNGFAAYAAEESKMVGA